MDQVRRVLRDKNKFFHQEYELINEDLFDKLNNILIKMILIKIVHHIKLDNKDKEEFQMREFYQQMDDQLDIEYLRYLKVFLGKILVWNNCINMKEILHRENHKIQMEVDWMKR